MTRQKMSEVYVVKDHDLEIFKIGQRAHGNSRMTNKASFLKNGYPTHLEQIQCTKPVSKEKATELEKRLHGLLDQWRTEYPATTISIEVDGKSYQAIKNANGFTEWFKIPEEMVETVIDLIRSV